MIRVLFVCMGNICRSPMAEGVFGHLVREAELQDAIECDSAGTSEWHVGCAAHDGTLRVLLRHGIKYDGLSRHFEAEDLEAFDYVVTMDEENRQYVRASGTGRARVAPLLTFAPATGLLEVPDPYYVGGFGKVYELVHQGAAGLLAHIRREHNL